MQEDISVGLKLFGFWMCHSFGIIIALTASALCAFFYFDHIITGQDSDYIIRCSTVMMYVILFHVFEVKDESATYKGATVLSTWLTCSLLSAVCGSIK